MKIGVLTYHKELSPGATFQAYATYRALKELCCEVEVIDLAHNPVSPRPKWQVFLINMYLSLSRRRQMRFRHIFYPPSSKHYYDINDLRKNPPLVDAICVGSDQTWNKQISTNENFMAYFLDFGPKSIPRFSYAASFGFSEWMFENGNETKHIGELLNNYIGLSVRERTGQKLIKDKFGLDSTLVCDPTLLHSNYKEFTKDLKQRNDVICYSLSPLSEHKMKAIHDISSFVGVPIRWMGKPFFVKGVKNTYFPDVYRWYRYIAGTKFVLTDSFHGTVAALLCKKPFAVLYKENGLSSRIVDLLTIVGLQDRLFFSYDDFSKSDAWKKDIDWSNVENKLEAFRAESWSYLKETISKIQNQKL